jgi:hypothetical protein
MHVGMRMGFAGRGECERQCGEGGMGMAEQWQSTECEWALRGGENEKDSAGMRMAEHGMTAYPLPP